MKQKFFVLLLCGLLLTLPGCSSGAADSGTPTADTSAPTEITNEPLVFTPAGEEKLHVTIESAEISVQDLKAQDYQVDLLVMLDKNPGVNNTQWGIQCDKKCVTSATGSYMIMETVCAVNDESQFLWTAWAGSECAETGSILRLTVKLPMDAAPGNSYYFTYADTSALGGSHQWKNDSMDYVVDEAVGWTDGVITIIE